MRGSKARGGQRRPDQRAPAKSADEGAADGRATASPAIRRFKAGFRWEHVELEPYKIAAHRGGEFRGASRQVLAGAGGEPIAFHLRYFELEPGGFTSLEQHRHAHVIIGVRGRGTVRSGDASYSIGRFDLIYIAPGQPHQLSAGGKRPFGFFCIVDARRDRPRPVVEARTRRLKPSIATDQHGSHRKERPPGGGRSPA
jgi:ribulose-bisphosphate carboxylase large chain